MIGWIDVDVGLPVKDGDYAVMFADGETGRSRWNIRLLRKPCRFLPIAHDYWSMEKYAGQTVRMWMPISSVNKNGRGVSA